MDRALEHDRPTLLFQLACEQLRTDKVERPGSPTSNGSWSPPGSEAQQETYRRLAPFLTGDSKALLDGLLVPDAARGGTALAWLRSPAVSNSPTAILRTLEKLEFLQRCGRRPLGARRLSPNRLKFLAQIARRSTNQALQRMPEQRRYPILVAFLHQTLVDLDRRGHRPVRPLPRRGLPPGRPRPGGLPALRRRGRPTRRSGSSARSAGVVLDPAVRDAHLRRAIYRRIPPDELRDAVEESDRIVRPADDHYFDFLESRYTYLRQFTPEFLDGLRVPVARRTPTRSEAVDLLRRLNAERRGRSLPRSTAVDFVPARWRPYVDRRPRADDRGTTSSCACSGSCAGPCGPGTSGWRPAAATPTPRRT